VTGISPSLPCTLMARIDPASDRALYRQLADHLRGKIDSEEWPQGTNLPSETSIGHDHEVGIPTVRRALALLRAEGLIEPVRGMPWRVRERREPTVVIGKPGDRVRARLATRADQERHGIPEGTAVLVIARRGEDERVYRADEHEVEFGDTRPGAGGLTA
jgi:DNA-binding GntR family transcriptional regulator